MSDFNDIDPVTGEQKNTTQGTSKGGTVHNLAEERGKRKKKQGINRTTILRQYLNALLGDPAAFVWPRILEPIATVRAADKSVLPCFVNEGREVHYCTPEVIVQIIIRYSEAIIATYGQDFGLTVKDATEVYKIWLAKCDPIPEKDIKPVAFKSDPSYTYRKLDFDPSSDSPTPTFDELLSRIDNRQLVLGWIGSLFVPDSSRQNYLWLHGTGGQGKSSLSLFLKEIFGPAYGSLRVPTRGEERFWTSNLLGKRLVVFPDCNEAGFVTTSLFKQITGDDAVNIEFKHGHPTTRDLLCKCFYISNTSPNVSGLHAEVRRLILAEVAPLAEGTEVLAPSIYRARLWAERAGFIGKALDAYYEVFKDNGDLSKAQVSSMVGLDDLIEENESEFAEAFDDYFVLDSKGIIKAGALIELRRKMNWSNYKIKKFYDYLTRKSPTIKRERTTKERIIHGINYRDKQSFYERNKKPDKPESDLSGMDNSF